jgi:hypothetical protein
MDGTAKLLLGIGIIGGAWWWWNKYGAANASLSAHAMVPVIPPQSPGFPVQSALSPVVAVAPAQIPVIQQSAQMTALLNWAQGTKNPALYQQMIGQLSAADLASMYDLLTTFWAGVTKSPTPAQTQFWNYLRGKYPFLNTGGVGCNNFTCT